MFRSTSAAGVASRKFIAGIRLCPPANGFASRVLGEQRQRLVERRGPMNSRMPRASRAVLRARAPHIRAFSASSACAHHLCRPSRAFAVPPRQSFRQPSKSARYVIVRDRGRLRELNRAVPGQAELPAPSICIVYCSVGDLIGHDTLSANSAAVMGPMPTSSRRHSDPRVAQRFVPGIAFASTAGSCISS